MPLVFPSRERLIIVESLLILLESVYTSVSDQRHFFRVNFFFKNVLVIAFSIFCFGISALDLFYFRIILFLFISHFISKNPKIFNYHYALHLAFCIVLALDLL